MSILKTTNFMGESPMTSPRALGNNAQVCSNLASSSTEFRPLMEDSVVAAATTGSKTLHRLTRDALGALRTGDTTGWITEVADKNYVKGQVNDDATERTYVSFNAGTTAPVVIDALGASFPLGIAPPTAVAATLNTGVSVTRADADWWLDHTFIPAVAAAVRGALLLDNATSRLDVGGPVAGPYSIHSLAWVISGGTDYWNLRSVISTASSDAAGLSDPRIDADFAETPGNNTIRIACLPSWAYIPTASVAGLESALAALVSPKDGVTQLLTSSQITALASEAVLQFSPTNDTLRSRRDSIDETVAGFVRAIAFEVATITPPVEPAKPTVPQYSTNVLTGVTTRAALWVTYDSDMLAYRNLLAASQGDETEVAANKSARITAIAAAQAKALSLTRDIEYASQNKQAGIELWLKELVTNLGLSLSEYNPDGLLTIDPDRILEARFYFSTFVTAWGEESAPSPLSAMVEVDQYSNVGITVTAGTPHTNVTKWRLYRSNSGSSGVANFQFVTEGVLATLTFTDTVKGEELGEVCPSVTWLVPPFRMDAAGAPKGADPYLRGLVGMPNGVLAGYVDNFVAFCDPYHPYAWPAEYQISLKHPVVGLGVFGQSLFVGTYANPSIISGADSASMSEQVLDDAQGCASARSIVSASNGVLYASPDGICFASLNGVEVVTAGLFAREDWQKLTPESVVAVMHESVYYFVYSGNGGGCYALDFRAKKLSRVDISATALFSDSLTDALFYASGTQVKRAFATGRRTGVWKSSLAVLPAHAGFAWLQVDGDQTAGVPATVKWYADGTLRHTATVTSIQPLRLPAGRYLEHEIEITSAARITKVMFAGSTMELQSA